MARGLLDRASSRAEGLATPPPPLRLLDRALDRELTDACALVGRAVGTGTQVILEAAVGAHPLPLFWAACDVRAAELCNKYGVELLLVEEDGRVRVRVDQYHAAAPGSPPRSRWYAWWRWRRSGWPGARA
jgi:hypothetical protein